MSANETRIKILCGVLQLERFTIADLCLHTGLARNQVYREIADLQNRELLTSAAVVAAGEALPHRAPKLYRLASDPERRAELQQEVNRFLPAGLNFGGSGPHLEKAQRTLAWITDEILGASIFSLSDQNLERWEAGLKTRFQEAGEALQRATWESELDFTEDSASEHPVAVETRLYRRLSERFSEVVRVERARRERANAEADWSKVLPRIARVALKAAVPAAALGLVSGSIGAMAAAAAAHELLGILQDQIAKGAFKGGLYEQKFKWLGASLQRDVSQCESRPDVLAALAKHFIAHSDNPEAPLKCIRQLNRERPHYRLQFDQANLALLKTDIDEAQDCWTAYRNSVQSTPALPSVIAGIAAKNWSERAYREAVANIAKRYAAAVTALSEVPFCSADDQSLGTQLFNPMYGKSEKEPEYISLSENAVPGLNLHVSGRAGEFIVEPGVPKLVYADLFCEAGMAVDEAWKTAISLPPEDRIIKVEIVGATDRNVSREVQHILKDHFPETVAFA